jgi:hypothetical protein
MSTHVTLDTNTLPVDDWLGSIDRAKFEFAVISVTVEEMSGTTFAVHLAPLERVDKYTAYGADPYGVGPYGGAIDKECIRRALAIITGGAFTNPDRVYGLSSGELRQRRDAEIICVHVRDKRDIFVTRDEKGFIRDGRRALFEAAFGARIMTPDEFVITFRQGPAA